MRTQISLALFASIAVVAFPLVSYAQDTKPLQILVVAGGCCHDYVTQTKLLKDGIEQRIHAKVSVVLSENTSTETTFELYQSDDWAKGFDVIVHDECSANVTERPYVERILAAHRNGVPAVNLHCAMHSYRWGDFRSPVDTTAENGGWYEMLGVQSTAHGPKTPIDVTGIDNNHPIMDGFADWTTIDEELYNNIRVYDGTHALVGGKQLQPASRQELRNNPNAQGREETAVVAWTNEYGPKKTRIFSTSLGHQNDTVADARYMDLVVRGILWASGNLTADGSPKAGLSKLHGTLIFADSFDRVPSQQEQEEIGNGWGSNSAARAGGHKQVDLRDGAMHIYIHESADHAVSVRHDAEFRDGRVEMRFMLEHPGDILGLDFADLGLDTVHAGHLFKVTIGTNKLEIMDSKTGSMSLKIRELSQEQKSTPEIRKLLASKKKITPLKLATGKWYPLTVAIVGDVVKVAIDGAEIDQFQSEGFAHPTKRMLRIAVPKQAVVDDVRIFSLD
ncbi:MAG: ThuA domain-containing protein [Planctomycetales bacterium]|nr:ThuA domain-containing protein [Planctomycetales bacterium]